MNYTADKALVELTDMVTNIDSQYKRVNEIIGSISYGGAKPTVATVAAMSVCAKHVFEHAENITKEFIDTEFDSVEMKNNQIDVSRKLSEMRRMIDEARESMDMVNY